MQCSRLTSVRPALLRRRNPVLLAALLLLASILLPGTRLAAQEPPATASVELDNGDRLTGTVVRLEAGRLTLATGWGGEVEIDWARVSSLTSPTPLRLVLADGRTVTVEAFPTEPIALAEIAAINPEKTPAVAWSGNVSAGLVATSGNTEAETAYLEGEVAARTEHDRYRAGASFKESKDDGETTSSRTAAFLGYERHVGAHWYVDGSASFTEDEFQDLDLRSTIAASAGYQIFDTEVTALSTELGVAYVDESFIMAPDSDYAAGRWALDLRRRISAERGIEIFHGHELLIGLEDGEDQLLSTKSGVRFQLLQKLVAAVQYKIDWDKSPPPGTVSTDRTILLNLGLEW